MVIGEWVTAIVYEGMRSWKIEGYVTHTKQSTVEINMVTKTCASGRYPVQRVEKPKRIVLAYTQVATAPRMNHKDDIPSLIDIALATKDKVWFDRLIRQAGGVVK